MKQNSLVPGKGLSMSQAQSISNLCSQGAEEINKQLKGINNFSKSIYLAGTTKTLITGKALPTDIIDLLKEKVMFHSCQAFLMENIKAKDVLLNSVLNAVGDFGEKPPIKDATIHPKYTSSVGEEWAWSQLSLADVNKYIVAETEAAHIGQFIHKDSILDKLRKELPTIKPTEWKEVTLGKQSPVDVIIHESHTPEKLFDLHKELAKIHREAEQIVNYYKAMIKNKITTENARIASLNALEGIRVLELNSTASEKYRVERVAFASRIEVFSNKFEETKAAKLKEVISMRIEVAPQFKTLVDTFLKDAVIKEEE